MVGVLDETGILRYGEVFIQYSKHTDKPQVLKQVLSGSVVVIKFPALHPGDVRKLTAVDVPKLHHLVDCIVFPQRGKRPHPDEMAGSDLDGDEYFVTWMPELIPEGTNKKPMDFTAPPKKIHNGPIQECDMIEYIADYIKNDNIGLIASAHLAQSDNQAEGIFSQTCREIAAIHAEAVDFAKTGYSPDLKKEHRPHRYPDFMGKRDKSSYRSKRILGALFRQCRQIDRIANQQKDTGLQDIPHDIGLEHHGWENYKDEAEHSRNRYNQKLETILNQYGITSESEALSGNIRQLGKRFTQRNEIYDAKNIIGVKIRQLRNATRRAFFDEFGGRDAIGEVFPDECLAKATAWYITTYSRVENPDRKYLSFPWVVADVLCQVRKKSPTAAGISVPSIIHRLSTEAEIGAYSQKVREIISASNLHTTHTHIVIIRTLQVNPWIQPTAGVLLEWCSKQSLRKAIDNWDLLLLLLGYATEMSLIRPHGNNTTPLAQSVHLDHRQPFHTSEDVGMTLLVDFLSFCASRQFHSSYEHIIPHGCIAPRLSRKKLDRISSAADKAYHSLALCGTIDSILHDYKGSIDDEIHEEVIKVGNKMYESHRTWKRKLADEFPNVEVSIRKLGGRKAKMPDALVTIKGPPYQVDEAHERIEEWESETPFNLRRMGPVRPLNRDTLLSRFPFNMEQQTIDRFQQVL